MTGNRGFAEADRLKRGRIPRDETLSAMAVEWACGDIAAIVRGLSGAMDAEPLRR
jgi:hypothetical protein